MRFGLWFAISTYSPTQCSTHKASQHKERHSSKKYSPGHLSPENCQRNDYRGGSPGSTFHSRRVARSTAVAYYLIAVLLKRLSQVENYTPTTSVAVLQSLTELLTYLGHLPSEWFTCAPPVAILLTVLWTQMPWWVATFCCYAFLSAC